MTNKELVEQAKNLSAARDNLQMAIDYLDMVSASVNSGDTWAGAFFSQTTALETLLKTCKMLLIRLWQLAMSFIPKMKIRR